MVKRTLIKPTELYKEAERRRAELAGFLEAAKKRILKAPEGNIRFIQRNNNVQYYLRTDPKDKNGVYLSKSEAEKIRRYLQKNYDEKLVRALEAECANLESFLKRTKYDREQVRNYYSGMPEEAKALIVPADLSDADYAAKWLGMPYEGKAIQGGSVFVTDRGEQVRSKSEMNIANMLLKRNVPYKYECPFPLKGGSIIYPDFTILNARERKIYYWEHRGMMDNPEYAQGAVKRNKDYMKNGVFPGDKLIITEETSAQPLGTDEIDAVIRKYLI